MMRLIMAGSSFQLLAALKHGGTEERVAEVGAAGKPAAVAEDGGHRAFEEVQALAVTAEFWRRLARDGDGFAPAAPRLRSAGPGRPA